MNKKKITSIVASLLLLTGLFLNPFFYMSYWYIEAYNVSGTSFIYRSGVGLVLNGGRENIPQTKIHSVGGYEVDLIIYPVEAESKSFPIQILHETGPYELTIVVRSQRDHDVESILLHEIKFQDDKYNFIDKFPVVFESRSPDSDKATFKEIYSYDIPRDLNFNWRNDEVVNLELDIEIIDESGRIREVIDLKLEPIHDKGFKMEPITV